MAKARHGEAKAWLGMAAAYSGADCLEWPFARTAKGYGMARFEGAAMNAHRAVCLLAHGRPDVGHAEAAHSCGNRACCNPAHIRHATSAENKADMALHKTRLRGERHGRAKLTEAQAVAVKASKAKASDVAKTIGVSPRAVRLIRAGVNWAHL